MAWSVDNIYGFTKFLTLKNQAGGISSNDLFYMWNSEQKSYQSDLLGRFQARNTGKEGQNTGLIENETIMQKLSPFTKPETLTIESGASDKPITLAYRLAMRINGYDAIKINQGQIAAVNNSVIDPPSVSANKYYFVEYEDYYSFLPNTVTAADLDYISTPNDIKWGFTYDANDRQVYNSGLSIQPQWNDLDIIEITKRALKTLGVRFKDVDFQNFGNSVITTGD